MEPGWVILTTVTECKWFTVKSTQSYKKAIQTFDCSSSYIRQVRITSQTCCQFKQQSPANKCLLTCLNLILYPILWTTPQRSSHILWVLCSTLPHCIWGKKCTITAFKSAHQGEDAINMPDGKKQTSKSDKVMQSRGWWLSCLWV